ncbi:MAG: phosphoglycolate phosphatase [Gammaproteobacteria bacterium]|jgi:phosphoglycolate phosphatase
MSIIELIVFDWDGTLMDSESCIVAAMRMAYEQLGVRSPSYESVRDIIGLSLDDAIRDMTPNLSATQIEQIAANYRKNFTSQVEPPALFPGVRNTLIELHGSGYQLAVATGKSQAGLARAIDESGLLGLFASTRAADQSAPKPSPLMLHEILGELNVDARSAIMIGDTTFDLEMARAAPLRYGAVTYGAHPVGRLAAYNPAFILNHFDHLTHELTTLNKADGSRS